MRVEKLTIIIIITNLGCVWKTFCCLEELEKKGALYKKGFHEKEGYKKGKKKRHNELN